MSLELLPEAAEKLLAAASRLRAHICGIRSRTQELADSDALERWRRRRVINIDGEVFGEGGIEVDTRPRRPARRGYMWVLVGGEWKEVRKPSGGD